jgi:ATP phosphoribosyltransferase
VNGSVEAACALGLADGIVDLVESGETMRAAKLHAISTLLETETILICNPTKLQSNPLIGTIKRRIEGVIAAGKYVYINYNIQRKELEKVKQVTPGKKAPTISPLENQDWIAVSAMVLKAQVADTMDKLTAIGAQDILVFTIHNCRV